MSCVYIFVLDEKVFREIGRFVEWLVVESGLESRVGFLDFCLVLRGYICIL